MDNNTADVSSVLIKGDKETVWDAITNENKLIQWYAPGSPWRIPKLKVGEKGTFTLMPSAHNSLTKAFQMPFTIVKVTPYRAFALYLDAQQLLLSFMLEEEGKDTTVTINSGGYDQSLANLKALVEGKERPFV